MLYAVKLQGIYTAYSYLSVRATVDLPLPENSIHAILFQLRLLAQRLLFALTSKPQTDIYYISYKGKFLQGEVVKKIAKEIQIGYNIK